MKRSALSLMVGMLMFAACGGDDSKDTGSTKSAETGKGAAGNSSELACGAETCKLPSSLKGQELCCKDMFRGGCGIKMGASCRPLPKVDDRCPTPDLNVSIPGMGNIVDQTFGCCTSDNECGIDFGTGCQPRTTACMFVMLDQVDKIKNQTCDGKELPLPEGCGMNTIMLPRLPGAAGAPAK